MANTKINVVVFDLGGVLIDMASGWGHAHRIANLDKNSIDSLPGDFEQKREKLAQDHQRGTIDLLSWSNGISQASNSIYTPENAVNILKAWIIQEFDGVNQIIEKLKNVGITTVGFSNTNALHWNLLGIEDKKFSSFPTLGLLDEIYGSHLIKQIKPDFKSFQVFEKNSNFKKENILFFDNEIENVASARQYGWHARHIHTNKDPFSQIQASLVQHRILPKV